MQLAVFGESLDRRDRAAVSLDGEHRARLHSLAVKHHGTRAAQRRFAADVRAGQFQNVAQIMDE
jgi:hypothetical protein